MSENFTAAKLGVAEGERFLRLRSQLGVSSFGLNQLLLAPGQRMRIHAHTGQEEVYIVLEGTLTLTVDGTAHELVAGDVARVSAEARRQLVNRHRVPVSVIALGGMVAHEHQSRDAVVYLDWDGPSAGGPQDVPLPADLPESELIG